MRAAWIGLGMVGLLASCTFLWTESQPRGEMEDEALAPVAVAPLLAVRPNAEPPPALPGIAPRGHEVAAAP